MSNEKLNNEKLEAQSKDAPKIKTPQGSCKNLTWPASQIRTRGKITSAPKCRASQHARGC